MIGRSGRILALSLTLGWGVAAGAERPGWVEETPPSTRETLYAVGIHTAAPTLEAGVADARRDAVGKLLAQFYGEGGGTQRVPPGLIDAAAGGTAGAVWGIEERERYSEDHPGGGTDVWVLVAADRERLHQQVLKFTNEILDGALYLYRKAQEGMGAGRTMEALMQLSDALERLRAVGLNPTAEALRARIRSLAAEGVGGLTLAPVGPSGLSVVAGQPVDLTLQVLVTRRGDPLPGVPLRIRFVQGQGAVQDQATTDARGIGKALLTRCDQGEPATLEVVPAFFSTLGRNGPKALIQVRCRSSRERPVALEVEEWQLDRRLAEGPIFGAIEDTLTHAGYEVLPHGQSAKAELTVRVVAHTVATEKVENLFQFCRARGQVEVIDAGGGSPRVLGSKAFDEKGAWKDPQRACLEALKRAAQVASGGVMAALSPGRAVGP